MSTTPVGDYLNKRYPPNRGATHWLGEGDDPGCCAGPHPACTYGAGRREAHVSLAAWFERAATQMHAGAADPAQREELKAIGPDVGSVIGALRYAEVARAQAGDSSSEGSGAGAVSREAPECSGDCGDAENAATEAAAAALAEMFGWQVDAEDRRWARKILAAAAPHIAAAERARIAAGLERRAEVTPATPYGHATAVAYRDVVQFIRDGLPDLERAEGEPS